MTPLILLDSLSAEIKKIVDNFRLDTKTDVKKSPSVHTGYLPLEDDDDAVFPYVIIRLVDVDDKENESIAKIVILIGTYSEDDDFCRDCINVGQRIRQELLIKRQLDNRFRLQLPFKLECPDGQQQPYPEAVAWLTTLWTIPQPQQKLEDGIYG